MHLLFSCATFHLPFALAPSSETRRAGDQTHHWLWLIWAERRHYLETSANQAEDRERARTHCKKEVPFLIQIPRMSVYFSEDRDIAVRQQGARPWEQLLLLP